MRIFLLIGVLGALVVAAYLAVTNVEQEAYVEQSDGETKTEQVQQQIDAAMQKNMEKLKQAEPGQ